MANSEAAWPFVLRLDLWQSHFCNGTGPALSFSSFTLIALSRDSRLGLWAPLAPAAFLPGYKSSLGLKGIELTLVA